ncbi:PREDICTED: short neuropeptide F-like [Cyphomyrmex costatus]|uniref:short neuropeptide F-like n=1 Tax=Cyphomyrmex costatus TaxID=456900 RepID=UPI0008523CFC|nr:PREDICTED: short neuropeptide F-like [Cyphomyrmex costatus]
MYAKYRAAFILVVVIVNFVDATENYVDYGEEMAEKAPAENIHELYKLLVQRNALNNGFSGIPLEQLMIRKSQRSPALRLRYGRSGPHISAGVLPKPLGAAAAAGYDDNN